MSQNRTVIQGLEAADTNMGNPGNFYSRSANAATKGTVVPGMMDAVASNNQPQGGTMPVVEQPAQNSVVSGKPIAGFLYSVSRSKAGEFWVLRLGRNKIGQSEDADIRLAEGTVSGNHATITIRQGKNGLIAAIRDSDSTNGTKINGELIDFEAEECHNGDVITIGNNYQLLFLLIDPAKYGLEPTKDFIGINMESEDDPDYPDVPFFDRGSTRTDGFDSGRNDSWSGGYPPAGGTVGLDGSASGMGHGGTVPM